MVDAVLALRGEAAGLVGARAQAALDLLADDDVLLLDLVAEGDRLLHRLPAGARAGLGEEPLEDRQRPIRAERQDDVRGHVVLVDVEHRVREEPVVEGRVLCAGLAEVAPIDAELLAGLQPRIGACCFE